MELVGMGEVARMERLMPIRELLRVPSPAPTPQALAHDGERLWMGSWTTQRFYGIAPRSFTVFEEANVPGRPVGAVSVGEELRVLCSEGGDADHRFIRRYIPGHGFKTHDAYPAPEDTGSFVAYDGEHVWLSQRYNRRIFELDARYRPQREIGAPAQVLGIAWVSARLYCSLWYGKDGGAKIGRLERSGSIEPIADVPFAAISLTHDGARFWSNDTRADEIVAFTLD